MVLSAAAAALVATLSMAWQFMGASHFQKDACNVAEAYLASQIVGQELAVGQLTDALCHHLAQPNQRKPLIISVHGPPGMFP